MGVVGSGAVIRRVFRGGGGRETGNNFIKVDFRPSVDEPATLRGRYRLRLETCGRRAGAAVLSASF